MQNVIILQILTFMKAMQHYCRQNKKYDLVIANINRNILLNDMEAYAKTLKTGGIILFSGFYIEDIAAIEEAANQQNMFLDHQLERNNWVSLKFIKK